MNNESINNDSDNFNNEPINNSSVNDGSVNDGSSNEAFSISEAQVFPSSTPGGRPRLKRSVTDKRIFGVCGGIAKQFDVDPTIVRLAFVAFAVLGGAAIPFYLVAAILMPEESKDPESPRHASPTHASATLASSSIPTATFA